MRRYALAAVAAAVVLLLVLAGTSPLGSPRAKPATAPADEFSAARALPALRALATRPRPIGSPHALLSRALVTARLRELHLNPRVLPGEVVSELNPRLAGSVHNVAARLPGRDPSRSVLLVVHYDSVAASPGAADDAAAVAALLETARALSAGPRPRNDVVFLFTDGEERGVLGAQAFLRDDPWAYGVGVVANFDSPGSSSPVLMYETSPGNGRLVRSLLDGVPDPFASSLMYEVVRRRPVIGDHRPFIAAGVPSMAFGALDGPGYYHTAYDSVDNLRLDSLQHQGETMLALARHLGEQDLWDLHRPDVVYFNPIGSLSVMYGRDAVVPLALAAVAAYAAALLVAARRRLLSLRGLAWAALGSVAALGASLALMGVVWGMYQTAYESRVWTETGVIISDLYRVGLVLLAAAVVIACYGLLLRRLRVWDLAAAALCWWAVVGLVVAFTVPGASFLLTWPLLAASLGLMAAALLAGERAGESWSGVLVVLAAAAPGVVLLSSATYLLLMSAGLKQVVTVTAVWLAAGLLVVPLAAVWRAARGWLPAALALAGFLVLFSVGSAVARDVEHPRFTSVYYRRSAGGETLWQTVDPVDDWTRSFLRERVRSPFLHSYFPQLGTRLVLVGAAPRLRLAAPTIRVLSDEVEGERRTVRLRLRSPRGAPVLSLLVHTVVGPLTASVDGLPLQGKDTTVLDGTTVRWSFDYYAPPPEGIVVTLRFAAGPSVLLRAVDFSYGLPPALDARYPDRPSGMLAGRLGDGALAERALRLPAPSPAP